MSQDVEAFREHVLFHSVAWAMSAGSESMTPMDASVVRGKGTARPSIQPKETAMVQQDEKADGTGELKQLTEEKYFTETYHVLQLPQIRACWTQVWDLWRRPVVAKWEGQRRSNNKFP